MRIVEVEFSNCKMFQRAVLQLGDLTLLIGPNGVGKTTALDALEAIGNSARGDPIDRRRWVPFCPVPGAKPQIRVFWEDAAHNRDSGIIWHEVGERQNPLHGDLGGARVFSIRADKVSEPSEMDSRLEFDRYGAGVATVLSNLQDLQDGRFESLNQELCHWIPEFARIKLNVTNTGKRSFSLETVQERINVPAAALSHGSLIAVALLTLAHLPRPPSIVGLEEIDTGLHPRLFRQVLDAMHRLSNPADFGDARPSVQVVMTSHSPYIVDLFRDHLEDVVVLEKKGFCSTFKNLKDIENIHEIVSDIQLGEAWFSGLLGGVPQPS